MAYQRASATVRARSLRDAETEAERLLWSQLRSRRLAGLKFVRQLPIGPFFADFACREKMLVVEVDGVTHGSEDEIMRDSRRTAFLQEQKWRVLRLWNHDVFANMAGVCDTILLTVEADE